MTTPAPSELVAVVTDGAPSADGGSPKGTGLMPAADPAPGECLSEEARYRSLHRTAVSFVSSDISVFFTHPSPTAAPPRAVVP